MGVACHCRCGHAMRSCVNCARASLETYGNFCRLSCIASDVIARGCHLPNGCRDVPPARCSARCDHGVVPTTHLTRIARKASRMSLSYLCIHCLDIEVATAGNIISTCFPGAQRNMDNGTGYSCMRNLIDCSHCLSSFEQDTRRLHSGKSLSLW